MRGGGVGNCQGRAAGLEEAGPPERHPPSPPLAPPSGAKLRLARLASHTFGSLILKTLDLLPARPRLKNSLKLSVFEDQASLEAATLVDTTGQVPLGGP